MPLDKPLLLLIEDEPLIAMTLEEELASGGFDLVLVSDGAQGIAELELDAARFSGLITDIRLPNVNGWAIATRARELVPTLPIVYMSGDSAGEWAAHGVPNSIMLGKPFAHSQLIAAIAKLLNDVIPVAPPEP